jgi:hypothetical protein
MKKRINLNTFNSVVSLLGIYDRAVQGCCGGNTYNKDTLKCCNKILIDPTKKGCCNKIVYDLDKKCCQDGVLGDYGCTEASACNYDDTAACDDGSCCYYGCTDAGACNYDPEACCDDGSCTYPSDPSIPCNCTDPGPQPATITVPNPDDAADQMAQQNNPGYVEEDNNVYFQLVTGSDGCPYWDCYSANAEELGDCHQYVS